MIAIEGPAACTVAWDPTGNLLAVTTSVRLYLYNSDLDMVSSTAFLLYCDPAAGDDDESEQLFLRPLDGYEERDDSDEFSRDMLDYCEYFSPADAAWSSCGSYFVIVDAPRAVVLGCRETVRALFQYDWRDCYSDVTGWRKLVLRACLWSPTSPRIALLTACWFTHIGDEDDTGRDAHAMVHI